MPDYYPVIRAARYLGVAPWELLERPDCWTTWALNCENGEAVGERIAADLAEQKRALSS